MLTFIYNYKSYYLGGVMVIQAEDRIKADRLFIGVMKATTDPLTEENLMIRECTGAKVINYKSVQVQVLPRDTEHIEILSNGDY